MSKAIDYFSVRFALFVILLIWFNYILGSFWGALIVGALTTLVICLILKIIADKTKKEKYGKERLYTQLALLGNGYTLKLFCGAKKIEGFSDGNYADDGERLFFCAFKFSGLSPDDVAAAYRLALDRERKSVTVICRKANRDTLLLAKTLPVGFDFVFARDLFKILKEANALPPLTVAEKPAKKSFDFRKYVDVALSPVNSKFYMFTGIVLALMVFVTPMKLYYVIMSSISLVFAVASKFYDR